MARQPVAVAQLKADAKQALLRRNFGRARGLLDDAIGLSGPQHSSYKLHRLRSVACACLGDYEAALDDAEAVIRLMPTLTDGYYHKGFSLFHLKDFSGAARAFSEGLALCPHDKILRQGFWDALSLLGQTQPQDPAPMQPSPPLQHLHQQLAAGLAAPSAGWRVA